MKTKLTIVILATLALGYVMWQPTPTIVGGIPDNEVGIYAEVDSNGAVLNVYEISMEMINTGRWGDPKTFMLVTPAQKNSPRMGYTYDKTNDIFVPPQPEGMTTILNMETGKWENPNKLIEQLSASTSEIIP